jgi:hypothetical protein
MDGNSLTDEDGLIPQTDTDAFTIYHSSSSVHLALVNLHITEKGLAARSS